MPGVVPRTNAAREFTIETSAIFGSATATVCKSDLVINTTKVLAATVIRFGSFSVVVTGGCGLCWAGPVGLLGAGLGNCASAGDGSSGVCGASAETAAERIQSGNGCEAGGTFMALTSSTLPMRLKLGAGSAAMVP